MNPRFVAAAGLLLLLAQSLAAVPTPGTNTVVIRQQPQTVVYLAGNGSRAQSVLFLPGDGGWRGTAVAMARTISGWGYDVFAWDIRPYLEQINPGGKLTQAQMASDVAEIVRWVARTGSKPVLIVGWSQGAGMSLLAAADNEAKSQIRGLALLGLPESAVLGWCWKDTVATLARRMPDEPTFPVKPLLGRVAPLPVLHIHSGEDEYTSLPAARSMYDASSEPKRWIEIAGTNHRFEGAQDQFYSSLREGLAWMSSLSK